MHFNVLNSVESRLLWLWGCILLMLGVQCVVLCRPHRPANSTRINGIILYPNYPNTRCIRSWDRGAETVRPNFHLFLISSNGSGLAGSLWSGVMASEFFLSSSFHKIIISKAVFCNPVLLLFTVASCNPGQMDEPRNNYLSKDIFLRSWCQLII